MVRIGGINMKKWAAFFLVLWLMGANALADITLSLGSDSLAVESILDFTADADDASAYRYTLFREEKKLFTTQEIPYGFGSYLPMQVGEYTLLAEALIGETWEGAQRNFTVTSALTLDIAPLPPSIQAGDGVEIAVIAQGGSGNYRYHYTISLNDQIVLAQEGPSSLLFVPEQPGDYLLSLVITDGMGAFAQKEMVFSVSEGPGISWQAAGGKLLAHGGQKAYRIYSPEKWIAETDSDFIRLLTAEGECGDLLILEIDEAVRKFRKGEIILKSGSRKTEITIGQSAGYDMEEELSSFPAAQTLTVDDQSHALWLSAEGEKSFAIQSDAPWQAKADGDFILMEQTEDTLYLALNPWDGSGVRSGTVTLDNGESTAFIHLYQISEGQKESAFIPQSPFPPLPEEDTAFITYSQCSGYWKDKKYRTSTLEHSGCAVFSLAHALQHLGYTGDEIRPEILAQTYAFALVQGGTMNDLLVGHAGDDFGFKTRYELYTDLPTIRSRMDQGAVYSFGVVTGHIAMIIEKNEDGTMFRVVDSAPSATWERIKNAQLFLQDADGNFYPINDLSQIPGIRYYIETGSFGGATYWLKDSYIAKRGVRLIQPR